MPYLMWAVVTKLSYGNTCLTGGHVFHVNVSLESSCLWRSCFVTGHVSWKDMFRCEHVLWIAYLKGGYVLLENVLQENRFTDGNVS